MSPIIPVLLVLSFFLTKCATATADPELRRAAANVDLVVKSELKDRKYEILAEVVGDSCGRQLGSSPTVEEAREQMRIEAGKLRADAVINFICEPIGVSMRRNCWKAIECRGDAIKWKASNP